MSFPALGKLLIVPFLQFGVGRKIFFDFFLVASVDGFSCCM